MGTRPRWTYKNQIWHRGSCGRRNHRFQILSKSVKGFPGCKGPKMGVSHWRWQSPLQQVSTTMLPVKDLFAFILIIIGTWRVHRRSRLHEWTVLCSPPCRVGAYVVLLEVELNRLKPGLRWSTSRALPIRLMATVRALCDGSARAMCDRLCPPTTFYLLLR